MQVALEQQVWVSSETLRPLPRPLPGRLAVPLIAVICGTLWAGLISLWYAVA